MGMHAHENPDPEPSPGWVETRKGVLVFFFDLPWIDKPPLESSDRTLHWLQRMKQESFTPVIKAYEDTEDPRARENFRMKLAKIEQYLTNLDADIVELRSRCRQIMEKVKD